MIILQKGFVTVQKTSRNFTNGWKNLVSFKSRNPIVKETFGNTRSSILVWMILISMGEQGLEYSCLHPIVKQFNKSDYILWLTSLLILVDIWDCFWEQAWCHYLILSSNVSAFWGWKLQVILIYNEHYLVKYIYFL